MGIDIKSQVNLFRMRKDREKAFRDLLAVPYETLATASERGFDFELLFRRSVEEQDVNWGWAITARKLVVDLWQEWREYTHSGTLSGMKLQGDFAVRFREFRRRSGRARTERTKRVRVTQQAVGLWENGKSAPHGEAVKKLARVFEVPSDDLLGLDKGRYTKPEQRVERIERMIKRMGVSA